MKEIRQNIYEFAKLNPREIQKISKPMVSASIRKIGANFKLSWFILFGGILSRDRLDYIYERL